MLNIRQIRDEDRDAFYELVQSNKERLADYFPVTLEKATTPDSTAEAIKIYNMLLQRNELHALVLEQKDTCRIIGIVFIKNIDPHTRKCELGYFIDKAEEGKGLMNYAMKFAIDMAFNQLNLNKVYCRVDVDNIKSNNIAARHGFKLEGVLRRDFRKSDGSLVDLNYYGLLKEENLS